MHVNCPILLSDSNQILDLSTDFVKVPNTKFHENPSSGSRADDTRGERERDGRT